MSIFYVYQLRLKTEEFPFYVGKGKGDRMYRHLYPSLLKKRDYKNNVIKKAIADGEDVLFEVICSGLTETDALEKEIALISFYGKRGNGGCLTNLSDGGEGPSGHRATEETREKIRLSRIGKKHSDATRKKMSMSKLRMTSDTKNKMSDARKGVTHEEEHKIGIKFSQWDRNPAWKIADFLYESWIQNKQPGAIKMAKIHPDMRVGNIVRSFKCGWIPSKDDQWNVYKLKRKSQDEE